MTYLYFLHDFGIYKRKSCTQNVGEIDPWCESTIFAQRCIWKLIGLEDVDIFIETCIAEFSITSISLPLDQIA